jgi:isoquinoline 1-oxidoreductase beta subunit
LSSRLPEIDRRTLLIGGGVGVGLVVAFLAWPRSEPRALVAPDDGGAFGHFITIAPDGRVTVAVPQAETGQGIWTALSQIVADELGAAWEMVAVAPAPLAPVYANQVAVDEEWLKGLRPSTARLTARSSSVRAFDAPLRDAAATARAMLIRAAARRWAVPAAECVAEGGFVRHQRQQIGFGELAEEAAGLEPPNDVQRRRPSPDRLIGQALPRLDLPAKSDGSFRFTGDVRLPEMLFAAARLAPPGGRLLSFSRTAAERAGAKRVEVTPQWLAVVAETSWAAERALAAANVRYQSQANETPLRERCQAALDGGALDRLLSRGDYDSAVENSRALTATYWIAPRLHAGLEPLSATARIRGGQCEVWAATQAPDLARAVAKRAAGTDVTFYPMPVGDSGGRALEADAIPIAVALAKRLGRPVQVNLSANVSRIHDRPAPGVLIRLKALPAGNGPPAAWKTEIATADGLGATLSRLAGKSGEEKGQAASLPPYAIANAAVDASTVRMPFAAGYMRGYPDSALTFATECFVDDLARAMGSEPLAYRMGMLSGSPRLARCLTTAAALGGWDGGGAGSSLGLACASAYGSHIALLAEASVGSDQRLAVHRLVAAVDVGRMINVGLIRQQVESGLLWAFGQATAAEPNFAGGMTVAAPAGLPRLNGTPDIRVEIVASAADPGGLSGLPALVLAPAVANAVAAGTGLRLRSLPFAPGMA